MILTRSYSCRGAGSAVWPHQSEKIGNESSNDQMILSPNPRIFIHQGRKIVRKKKRKCVKCKTIFFISLILKI